MATVCRRCRHVDLREAEYCANCGAGMSSAQTPSTDLPLRNPPGLRSPLTKQDRADERLGYYVFAVIGAVIAVIFVIRSGCAGS